MTPDAPLMAGITLVQWKLITSYRLLSAKKVTHHSILSYAVLAIYWG